MAFRCWQGIFVWTKKILRLENPIKALRKYVTHYINLRFQEFRMEALERVVNVMGFFIFGAIVFFLMMVMFGFAAFGFAEYLCDVFKSRTAGYFAVAGIILLLLIIMILMKKFIFRVVGGKMLSLLTQPHKREVEEDDDDEEE